MAEAERLARLASAGGDDEAYVACGMAYLDAHNTDEEHAAAPELLHASATCFAQGKSLGVAVGLYEQVEQHPRAGRLAVTATLHKARLYERAAALDRAAAAYDRYARRAPGEAQEFEALTSAVTLYAIVGNDKAQLEALRLLLARFGEHKPRELAELVLAATAAYERRGVELAIAHLRKHQGLLSLAEPEVALRAQGRLAGLLWAKSCPGGGQDGLCVRTERARSGAGVHERCGEPAAALAVVPRDAQAVRLAQEQQRATVLRFEQGADSTTWGPRTRHAYALAKLALADASFEAFLALAMPRGLAFDQPAVAEASRKRLERYLAAKTAAGARARAEYEAVIATKDALAAIAAAARIGQLARQFADELTHAPVPRSLLRGAYAAEARAAYCARMDDVAAPIAASALEAFRACAHRASSLGVSSSASRLCVREVTRADPTAAAAMAEPVPAPTAAILPLELEPAPAQISEASAPLAAALDRHHRERATWSAQPAACGKLVSSFEREAHGDFAVVARYLAGRTSQLCDRPADAAAAYRSLAGPVPADEGRRSRELRAMARSNLGVTQWRGGDSAAAKASWEAALTLSPRLFAARVNAAAARLAEARAPGLPAAQERRLLQEGREHASAAAAMADHAAAFVLLGVIALEQGQLGAASHFLQRARALDASSPYVATFEGVLAADRGDVWQLEPFSRAAAATPSSDEARRNLGLAFLHLSRYGEAHDALAAVKGQDYDLALARGIAARGLDKLDEAEAHYRAAISLDTKRPEAPLALGVLWKHYRAAKALGASDTATARAALATAASVLGQSAHPDAKALAAAAECERKALEAGAPIRLGQGCGR